MSDSKLDLVIVGLYLVGMLVFGLWVGRREKSDREGYFLGGRRFGWLAIGTSLFATNISSINFVGHAGLAYKAGMAAANPQLIGGLMLALAAVVFIPVFLRSRLYTIPDFLEQRFDRRAMLIYCIVMLLTGLVAVPTVVYAGCLVVLQLFGFDAGQLPWCALIMGGAVGVYTIAGGLASVVYTDMAQAALLLLGGVLVLWFGLDAAGGLSAVLASTPAGHLQLVQPSTHAEMPASGVFTGLLITSFFWASSNHELLQRTLGARDTRHAQLGMLLAAFLKIGAVFLLVFPGLIALKLFPGVAPDLAYPTLVKAVLPAGLSGLVLAGFLAALMSSLDSALLSLSSVFTLKIYPLLAAAPDEQRSLRVGRLAAGALLLWGIVAAPFIQHLGLIYLIGIKVNGFMMSSIGACYVLGRFSRRVNARGANVTLSAGLLLGVYLVLVTTLPDGRRFAPAWLTSIHFFHLTAALSVGFMGLIWLVSLTAPGPGSEQLRIIAPVVAAPVGTVAGGSAARPALPARFGFWLVIYLVCFGAVYAMF